MKIIVLDTNVLIDNVHGFAPWVNELLKQPQEYHLVLPTIVVSEYLAAKEMESIKGEERSKSYLTLFDTADLTFGIAEILGQILRRKTYSVGADIPDLIVASTAIYLKAELATKNKSDFEEIPNLRLFDPRKLKN